ncbi:hypothetical protein GOBAR_DD00175 [Gossypium barbadense]|nr:hypothetical protein GOBAR_DD00175 [Gossypium barbadense]
MATAAGAAALLYYTLNRKLQTDRSGNDDNENGSDLSNNPSSGLDRVSHRLIQAPATWVETISTLSETLRFTYSETLGKWPIGDLAFGINFLLKRQGHLHVASVFGGKDSIELKGPDISAELKYLLNLLTLCWHFSKKPFPLFLEETGYAEEDVLLQEPKAGILKPAFTILVDHKTECFLLLIRGTHSIKDTLTAATGAIVPFHHSVVQEGGVSDLVLGYAHCGMVAAARWIAKLATPCLIKALGQHPTYKVKIVGHSLGGGTGALLTYVLREQKELSTTTCVTFAPDVKISSGVNMDHTLSDQRNRWVTDFEVAVSFSQDFSRASSYSWGSAVLVVSVLCHRLLGRPPSDREQNFTCLTLAWLRANFKWLSNTTTEHEMGHVFGNWCEPNINHLPPNDRGVRRREILVDVVFCTEHYNPYSLVVVHDSMARLFIWWTTYDCTRSPLQTWKSTYEGARGSTYGEARLRRPTFEHMGGSSLFHPEQPLFGDSMYSTSSQATFDPAVNTLNVYNIPQRPPRQ